jgi:hypothetical protein
MRERDPKVESRRGQADEALLTLVRLLARRAAHEVYCLAVDAPPSRPIKPTAHSISIARETRDD